MLLDSFKGQLHVAVLVIVINILPPIMHGKKIEQVQTVVTFPVLQIVVYQYGQFEQLAQTGGTEEEYCNGNICE